MSIDQAHLLFPLFQCQVGPTDIITTTTTRLAGHPATRLAGSISIARPVWWLDGDFFHQVDESIQAAQLKISRGQVGRPYFSCSPCAMLSLVRSVLELQEQESHKSNDKVGRGELGQEQLTPT